ncbi:hypothetical protein KY289_034378 [Solanum tuberosum]|nr:hypothetical protein KY289_034378 [Solanum tuberosum]KAH0646193.1 hypothetical protein KY284_034077 [Solanum tuberosum]
MDLIDEVIGKLCPPTKHILCGEKTEDSSASVRKVNRCSETYRLLSFRILANRGTRVVRLLELLRLEFLEIIHGMICSSCLKTAPYYLLFSKLAYFLCN